MVRCTTWPIAVAIGASLSFGAAAARAQSTDAAFKTTTLNLTAESEVRTAPDIVTLGLGVTSEAASAQEATRLTSEKLNAIVAAMKRMGVATRDIQTQSINLRPTYSDRSNSPREIVAHQATASVSVISRDLDRAGALLDAAVAAGANQVQGVRFGVSDPAVAQRRARDLALATLQRDADEVAQVMGQRVVRLVNVSTRTFASPVQAANRIETLVVTGSRIEPGDVEVHGSASGVFELAPR